jgi:hypothetical protein
MPAVTPGPVTAPKFPLPGWFQTLFIAIVPSWQLKHAAEILPAGLDIVAVIVLEV